jgi:exonuclease VII large subunit
MFDKKKDDAERILEMTEKILHVVTQAFEKSAYQDDRINGALEKIDHTLETITYQLDHLDQGLGPGLRGALEEANERFDELAAAVCNRDELEAEIVKLKKILERRERRHG